MRTLLARIFVTFWLAMTLAGLVLLMLENSRTDRLTERWRVASSDAFSLYTVSAARPMEPPHPDTAAVREFLQDLESRTSIRAWLFDSEGKELSGYAAPALAKLPPDMAARLHQLMQRSQESGHPEFLSLGAVTLAAHHTITEQRQGFTLAGVMPTVRYGPWQARPQIQVLRLLAILFTAGAVSWVLSRQLTAPIERLRAATQLLASGDLTARATSGRPASSDELAQLAHDFDSMAERIQQLLDEQIVLMKAQKRLLRDVSHELRSPLARLGIALELARDRVGELQPADMEFDNEVTKLEGALDRIEQEAAHLSDMVDRLLVLARLESGIQHVTTTSIDLAALVQAVVADADFEAKARQRRVELTHVDNCTTAGIRNLLRSAIENVIRNALSYTGDDGVVEVELRRYHGAAAAADPATCVAATDDWAIITVRDHGPGAPEDELPNLFQPFYRASNSHTRVDGSGVGLAITERAISLHGGLATASNASDGGMVIKMWLPMSSDVSMPIHNEMKRALADTV